MVKNGTCRSVLDNLIFRRVRVHFFSLFGRQITEIICFVNETVYYLTFFIWAFSVSRIPITRTRKFACSRVEPTRKIRILAHYLSEKP